MAIIDLTSLRFGKLMVVGLAGQDNFGHTRWKCRCDCGKEMVALSPNLRSGHVKSCGCLNGEHEDLSGKRYGRLVVQDWQVKKNGRYSWRCVCDCGLDVVVKGSDLKSGHTRSCGCLAREVARMDKKHESFTGRKIGRLFVLGVSRRMGRSRYWECRCECGNVVEVLSGHLRNGNTSSCGCYSKEVAKKRMSELQRKKKEAGLHGNRWKPELTMEERQLRHNREYLPRYSEWRMDVYRRDRWCCQVCGLKGGKNIRAHHLASWADNSDLRFDVGNGVTACGPCHKEFHSRFGWGNNTAAQWREFVDSKQPRRAIA